MVGPRLAVERREDYDNHTHENLSCPLPNGRGSEKRSGL